MRMTGNDVILNALSYIDRVYWYGGKDEACTESLLRTLSNLYPRIYTPAYIAKCKNDIAAGKRCIDCSGLVCRAYDVVDMSTYSMRGYFSEWKKKPLNGMILWTINHCGIYYNDRVIEARGIDKDVTTNRDYIAGNWSAVLYDMDIDYMAAKKDEHTGIEYLTVALKTAQGYYGNGDTRKTVIKFIGYDYDKVQAIINAAFKKGD